MIKYKSNLNNDTCDWNPFKICDDLNQSLIIRLHKRHVKINIHK